MSIIVSGESTPVSIDTYTVYCESFTAECNKIFSEKSTISGSDVISQGCKKAMTLKLTGRICDVLQPLSFVVSMNSLINSNTGISIEYKGVIFSNCLVTAFTADDSEADYLKVSVSLITADNPVYKEVSQ